MHGIINTASASMSMYPYLALLKPQGKMILLGLPEKPLQISAFSLVAGKSVFEFGYSLCREHLRNIAQGTLRTIGKMAAHVF
jgi:D-arabinose 1-dehydrogenase-like Zn-dependent alcohol dehydrogenase